MNVVATFLATLLLAVAAQAAPLVVRFGVASPSRGIPPGFAGGSAGVSWRPL